MIASQLPPPSVFIRAQAMASADVAAECLAPIAAIQANHVILMNGSPYRHGGNQNFLCLNGLSELTQRMINCGNQVRKLLWSQRVVPNVAADDHSRGMRGGLFGIHAHPFALSWLTMM